MPCTIRSQPLWKSRSMLQIRWHSTVDTSTIINIPKSSIYRFGDPVTAQPVFRDVEWKVHEKEAWAVVGSGSGEKTTLFQTLLGHLRISPPPPPPGGLFPFLTHKAQDPFTSITLVSFGNRRRAAGSAFYDFSARYGAVRDEDRITLRQSMFPETIPPEFPALVNKEKGERNENHIDEAKLQVFDSLVERIGLKDLLDLPLITLSNGQTRRARIVKAILNKPELLLLDEPLTGLDTQSRPTLLELLHSLHTSHSPRMIIGLRTQDPVPEWITHLVFVKNGKVVIGPKNSVLPVIDHIEAATGSPSEGTKDTPHGNGDVVVDLRKVNVKYGTRTVLKNIDWQIRKGERWHLQGSNGSGKTTLLALLTGAHPQSYTQPHLHLFSLPRSKHPTPHLQSLIGLLSPELFNAFPRRANMKVWDAIGTGFDGGYVPLGKDNVGIGVLREIGDEERKWRVGRVWEVLEALGPRSWGHAGDESGKGRVDGGSVEKFKERAFVDLPVDEQRMVLFMRALVGRPPLVLLDEVWSGMGEGMVNAARRYLREGGVDSEQAVVAITHWEEEVPWTVQEGLRRFNLNDGVGRKLD